MEKIKIKISNTISIPNPPAALMAACKKSLTIPNPLYYKLMRATGARARAFYGCPKTFQYFRLRDDSIELPRGFRDRLIDWLKAIGMEFKMEEEFVDIPIKV